METIGVLALQGSFAEHMQALRKIAGINPILVKTADELARVDRLIIPGGESTTIGKLLNTTGLSINLCKRILSGMPVWGTCAGLILLAKKIDDEQPHLAVMDICVKRNAYGSQLASFECQKLIPEISNTPINMVLKASDIMLTPIHESAHTMPMEIMKPMVSKTGRMATLRRSM